MMFKTVDRPVEDIIKSLGALVLKTPKTQAQAQLFRDLEKLAVTCKTLLEKEKSK